MVSVGSKSLLSRKHKTRNLTKDSLMAGEYSPNQGGRRNKMSRKAKEKNVGFDGGYTTEGQSGCANKAFKERNSSKHHTQTSFVRKQVDPETAKYFSEIANVIEGSEIDPEERSVICGNALEETRGKELQLATDYIISHTLQILLEDCSIDHLCGFLRSCTKDFSHIATDRSGSHVVETAFKSLSLHLEDNQNYTLVEDTLTTICKAIVGNPVDVMCNCYGSHVLRSLLCLCKGVPQDSSEFHATNPSLVLAVRLNVKMSHLDSNFQEDRFPNLLKFLVCEMLNAAKEDIATLQVGQYSSLVLQTALKLLAGNEQELLHIIPILLGCDMERAEEGNFIEVTSIKNLLKLMKEASYSRLMEVILEVAPQTVYNELFTKVFRNSLFDMSSHFCGNFIVQALFSQARSQDHVDSIWEELGTKFRNLLEMGKCGVIACLIAACQRLHSHERKCCQALAAAVCLGDESPKFIVPRILFLDNYFSCEDKSSWSWPSGVKMHVVGSLILQSIFKFPSEFIQAYITSITSLEADQVFDTSKDAGGARVVEAFLTSNASGKQKYKLVVKLRGHFGELSVQPSGSFTVEKCFTASNTSMRETIVSELLATQTELSRTKQGPYLLRKLDVDGFARHPDEWKSRQTSKQSAYKAFYDAFGPKGMKSSKNSSFLADNVNPSHQQGFKQMRREIDACLSSVAAPSGLQFSAHKSSTKLKTSGAKRPREKDEQHREKFFKPAVNDDGRKIKNRKHKKTKHNVGT